MARSIKGVPAPAKRSSHVKADHAVGSGSANVRPVTDKAVRKAGANAKAVSSSLGSGSVKLDPLTVDALKKVGC